MSATPAQIAQALRNAEARTAEAAADVTNPAAADDLLAAAARLIAVAAELLDIKTSEAASMAKDAADEYALGNFR